MAHIEDRWVKKDKTRTPRYGKGMRYRVVYVDQFGVRQMEACESRDQANVVLSARTVELHAGTYVSTEKRSTTFGDLWPRFDAIKSGMAKKTHEMYVGAWTNYVRDKWSAVAVREVKGPEVAEWITGLKSERTGQRLSESYEHKVLLTMKGLCQLAIGDGVMAVSPLADVHARAQPSTSRRYLEVDEADALVAAMVPNDLMVEVMLHTCIRRGEAAGLKVGDLSSRRMRLRIERDIDDDGEEDQTKGKRHRDVPVSGKLLDRLVAASQGKKVGDYLMTDAEGRPWTKHTWRYVWEKNRDASGVVELATHELRHTGVSWAIHSGANIKTIQRMCGHASAAMTLDIYGHLWDAELDVVSKQVYTYLDQEREASKTRAEKKKAAEAAKHPPTPSEHPMESTSL